MKSARNSAGKRKTSPCAWMWYRPMYYGETAGKKKREMVKRLCDGKIHKDLYVLCLPTGSNGSLEIFPYYILGQEYYQKSRLYIIGIAHGKAEALELACRIVTESMKYTGSEDVASYLGDDFCSSVYGTMQEDAENLYGKWHQRIFE